MTLLDIHTHRVPMPPFDAIWSCKPEGIPLLPAETYYSAGIHPWHLSADGLQQQLDALTKSVQDNGKLIAIGEAGMDKAIDTSFALQIEAFDAQVALSEEAGLPLIIHAVKAHNEIMERKKRHRAQQTWIIHGFRGKRQLAEQYLRERFYLSFGTHFNQEALLATPPEQMFFETDEATEEIVRVYARAARTLRISPEELTAQTQRNIRTVFFNR